MKKNNSGRNIVILSSIMAAALVLQIFSGCASSKVAAEESSPVAILTVVGNSTVPWIVTDVERSNEYLDGEPQEEPGLVGSALNNLLKSSDPELSTAEDRVDYLASAFERAFSEAGLGVVSKDAVVGCESYAKVNPMFLNALQSQISASGYKDLSVTGKLIKNVAAETGAKTLICCKASFKKRKIQRGFMEMYARPVVFLEITVYNSEGKRILLKSYEVDGTVSDEVTYANGKWDKAQFCGNFYGVIDRALKVFINDSFAFSEVVPAEDAAGEDDYIYDGEATPLTLPSVKRD